MGASVSALLIVATLGSPLWLFLAKKLGKYRAWMLFNFGNVVTNALFFLPQEGQTLKLVIVTALNGLPIGGTFLVQSVLSDIIDYDEVPPSPPAPPPLKCAAAFSNPSFSHSSSFVFPCPSYRCDSSPLLLYLFLPAPAPPAGAASCSSEHRLLLLVLLHHLLLHLFLLLPLPLLLPH